MDFGQFMQGLGGIGNNLTPQMFDQLMAQFNLWGNSRSTSQNPVTWHQYYNQNDPMYADNSASWNPMFWAMQGVNTMQNLGNTIGNGFGFANALSSKNMQEKYGPMSEVLKAQIMADADKAKTQAALQIGQQRVNQSGNLLPMLISALQSGFKGSGGGGGPQGFSTNYGAGATLGQSPQGAALPNTPRAALSLGIR